METAKQQAREAQHEIRALKARLARALGEEVAAEHPEHGAPSGDASKSCSAQVEQLLGAQGRAAPPAARHRGRARGGATAEPHADARAQHGHDRAAAMSAVATLH